MTALVADKLPDDRINALEKLGCSIVYQPELKDDALAEAMRTHEPDILIVRSTKVPAKVIEAYAGLNLIIRAGAGYNTIDVDAASARSVYVSNCPGKNSTAVAELAFGLLLCLDRRIPDNVADLETTFGTSRNTRRPRGSGAGPLVSSASAASAARSSLGLAPSACRLSRGAGRSRRSVRTSSGSATRRRRRRLPGRPTPSVSTSRRRRKPGGCSVRSSSGR